jgi:hypothetical protein
MTSDRARLSVRLARLAVELDEVVQELIAEPLDEVLLAAPVAHLALSLAQLDEALCDAEGAVSIVPPARVLSERRVVRHGQANQAAALIEVLTDELGTPLVARRLPGRPVVRYFPCPVCGGGMRDHSLFPYRPLTVSDDGNVWCAGMIDRTWARATCSFTADRLHRALDRMRAVAA